LSSGGLSEEVQKLFGNSPSADFYYLEAPGAMMLRLFLTALTVFALSGIISAQKITYETEPGVDFSKFKTYKWQRADDARYPDQATDSILVSAIDEQLAAKGLVRTESETADMYVVYQLAVVDDMSTSSFKSGGRWLGVPNSNPGFSGVATNSSEVVKKGWLLVDLYDMNQKKLVWRASATKALKGKGAEQIQRNARKSMGKIFNNFPPGRQ
jgi:hypothetical protein